MKDEAGGHGHPSARSTLVSTSSRNGGHVEHSGMFPPVSLFFGDWAPCEAASSGLILHVIRCLVDGLNLSAIDLLVNF